MEFLLALHPTNGLHRLGPIVLLGATPDEVQANIDGIEMPPSLLVDVQEVPVAGLELRYDYTSEHGGTEAILLAYSSIPTTNLSLETMAPPTENADRYVRIV